MSTESLPDLLAEYAELERRLSDPAVHADPATAREVGRRYAELTSVVTTARELQTVRADAGAARELAREDSSFAAEAEELATRIGELEERLRELLMPEAADVDVAVDPNDLRIDVFRSSGPGGQSVNTTDSAVRITHLPTGIVVACQNERSQLQNKEQAMRILRARLLAAAQEEADREAADARRSQIRTVDRSERVRTYNFPQNRISDHRVGYTAYNLDLALGGDLDGVLDALTEADRAARLAGEAELSRR